MKEGNGKEVTSESNDGKLLANSPQNKQEVSLTELMFSVYARREGIKEKVKSIEASVNLFGVALGAALRRADTFIQGAVQQVREVVKEGSIVLQETTTSFKKIMIEAGFPPHDLIPLVDMPRIVKIYDEKGIEYTKRVIERYFTLFIYREEELRSIQERWQNAKWLENRVRILSTAVTGHINGYYELTIPTLLAQTEGILVGAILEFDELEAEEEIRYKKQKNFLTEDLLNDNSILSYDRQIERIYKKIILAGFTPGKSINSNLSRHAILHGADTDYGTRINSLKSILIFDYIFGKLDEKYADIQRTKEEIRQRKLQRARHRKGLKNNHNKMNKSYHSRNARKLTKDTRH